MKNFFCLALLYVVCPHLAIGQNVGIGTSSPEKLLSVNGSLLIDQGNTNMGTLDSAALRFGTNSMVGISSNRSVPANGNPDGLDFWTNGFKRMVITNLGRVGIGKSDPAYPLDVGGIARVGYLYTAGISSTASIYTDLDLYADDDLYVGDDATINGLLGVGGSYDLNYRLKVVGNGLFTTNVGIDGTLRVDGKITNDGKGIIKSNSSTTLRAGFSSGAFQITLSPNESSDITFCVTKFAGDNDNIRVMPAQFIPGAGNSNAGCIVFTTVATAATSAACGATSSQATIRVTNTCSVNANTGTNSRLYLFSVVTD